MDLSIIIPAYNEQDYIKRTLESINLDDVEIIVVCNGCTDKTYNITKRYARKSRKNIKAYNLKKKGVSHARNHGARKATKSKLIFLDADTRVWHHVLEKINDTKFTVGTCYVKPETSKFVPNTMMRIKNFAHHFGTCTGLIFCTKELFETIGGFDEDSNIGEDGKFLRHAKRAGKFGVVNAYAYYNLRRFRKKGYARVCGFWIRHFFNPKIREYEAVR